MPRFKFIGDPRITLSFRDGECVLDFANLNGSDTPYAWIARRESGEGTQVVLVQRRDMSSLRSALIGAGFEVEPNSPAEKLMRAAAKCGLATELPPISYDGRSLEASTQNVFQIHTKAEKVPFAISRANWQDTDLIIVMRVEPKGKYGKAFGFPVRDGTPNDHGLVRSMEVNCAGCYQWRAIPMDDATINLMIERFYSEVAPRFGIVRTAQIG